MMNKPEKKHVTVHRYEGSYNIFDPKEVTAQYHFRIPHLTHEQIKGIGLEVNFHVDIEKDLWYDKDYSPLDVAYEIRDIYEGYWIHTGKDKIKKMIEYLESIEEEQERLRHQYDVRYANYQISYWARELENLLD